MRANIEQDIQDCDICIGNKAQILKPHSRIQGLRACNDK